jgi:hypothetical protein
MRGPAVRLFPASSLQYLDAAEDEEQVFTADHEGAEHRAAEYSGGDQFTGPASFVQRKHLSEDHPAVLEA